MLERHACTIIIIIILQRFSSRSVSAGSAKTHWTIYVDVGCDRAEIGAEIEIEIGVGIGAEIGVGIGAEIWAVSPQLLLRVADTTLSGRPLCAKQTKMPWNDQINVCDELWNRQCVQVSHGNDGKTRGPPPALFSSTLSFCYSSLTSTFSSSPSSDSF